jgi:hypothetical protein
MIKKKIDLLFFHNHIYNYISNDFQGFFMHSSSKKSSDLFLKQEFFKVIDKIISYPAIEDFPLKLFLNTNLLTDCI